MNLLFVGDVIGRCGRRILSEHLDRLVDEHMVDLVVANGENAAGGFGLTLDVAREMFGLGVDVITSGNHIWDKREIYSHLDGERPILRPANYPPGLPGRGVGVFTTA
ncbi:MAG TPA: YmdB family metallophosphoesterase, partial [Desulfuromonadales bacterium]|nr:YmdB family metallophosphoesterase [Desulfuromonadales bacterium]